MNETENVQITRTWDYFKHDNTVVLSIPRKLCKKYGITSHTNLLTIDTGEGILFKKLELEKHV